MICDKCRRRIRTGEPRYTIADSVDGATGRHWECHERNLREFEEAQERLRDSLRRFDSAIKRLRRGLR